MRVVIVNAQTPFVRGGAEMLADNLLATLKEAGHEAELVTMPFKWYPAERICDGMLAARLLEVDEWCGGRIDRLIGLKFPAYLMRHPCKVMWLLHQYRGAYDLWGSPIGDLSNAPAGRAVRDMIHLADAAAMAESRAVYTISRNVTDRLRRFNGIDSMPLYHPPPGAELFRQAEAEDFFLCPGRINPTKRQGLVVDALLRCRSGARVVFTGVPDSPAYAADLARRSETSLGERVTWRGAVTEAEKLDLYARCLGVIVTPIDEDYGYVTLEAMLSAKPVLTCSDSGGPLDFVEDSATGFVCAPDASAVADGLDRLWQDRRRARDMGQAGLARYRALGFSWADVVSGLLA
ncbi:glycosyltransferase [Roseomonas nepalensis]|uniref:Glycosyltransferase n=1 Tax=Muricoccus nepalensis TaxID=1854500 RepID=A0A502FAT0_9PROT|nr:glycosyltransferase family 4 protein [Roseomonas nepalensis]TPG46414.1 glycosyltransferase [Roseomonas nepalensis]